MIMDNMKHLIKLSSILIVDDNPVNVELLESMLCMSGYKNITCTTDSSQVVNLYHSNTFDLILLDICMPQPDGFEVMQQLSAIVEEDYLPILVLSAQQDTTTKLRALEMGAKDFVVKPFDRVEVLNRISNMLEVRALYNERKLQTARLEEQVEQRTDELSLRNAELQRIHLAMIDCLARAGEYRDNETGFHVMRMSRCCEALALAAGMGEKKATEILHASPMHDIGKIGIPDSILLKPGALDKEERQIMMSHVNVGVSIIGRQASQLMKMACSIAQNHHEKWDGSGYPSGLKGDKIPIEGRISAICDVFDALMSNRPYKKPWPLEEAIDFMKDGAGNHFDPRLITIFFDILPDIIRIRAEYLDE